MFANASPTDATETSQTVTVNWDGNQLNVVPYTLDVPPGTTEIVFVLQNTSASKVQFRDRGIVFQYGHQPLTHGISTPSQVTFVDNVNPADGTKSYNYVVLLEMIGDDGATHVCYFDPTVENDPPPPHP